MIPNARTLLERRELLGQLGIHFQLADFPQRLGLAPLMVSATLVAANCGGRESEAP